jgi:SAM-dependent methyltransferase
MSTAHTWNFSSAELYEEYLVPAMFAPFAERLVGRVAPARGERVLDLACGTGAVARAAAARGAVVTGLDINPAMVEVARSRGSSVRWRVGDAAAPGALGDAYDLLICQQGLQFLPDPAAAFAAWRRLLRPGGRLAVSVWRSIDHQPGYRAFADALDRVGGDDLGAVMRAPFSGAGRAELAQLATRAGLHDVRTVIDVGVVRFPSADEFLRRQVAASPLAAPVGALAEDQRAVLPAEVADAMGTHTDDDGVTWPLETIVLTATR